MTQPTEPRGRTVVGPRYHHRGPVHMLLLAVPIVLIDQFSRNLHRGSARAFAHDAMALVLAQEAVAQGLDAALAPEQRAFVYMPYMHSESRLIHVLAENLFRLHTTAENHGFELRHKLVVDRYGRYPHRNAVLGRVSTDEELAFLLQPGSSF